MCKKNKFKYIFVRARRQWMHVPFNSPNERYCSVCTLHLGFAPGVEQKCLVLDPDLMICRRSLPFLRSVKREKRRSSVLSQIATKMQVALMNHAMMIIIEMMIMMREIDFMILLIHIFLRNSISIWILFSRFSDSYYVINCSKII